MVFPDAPTFPLACLVGCKNFPWRLRHSRTQSVAANICRTCLITVCQFLIGPDSVIVPLEESFYENSGLLCDHAVFGNGEYCKHGCSIRKREFHTFSGFALESIPLA